MEELNISLKRNSFMIFIVNSLPILFWGILINALVVYNFSNQLSIVLSLIIFIVSVIAGIRALKGNKNCLVFSDNTLTVCEKKKNQLQVLGQYNTENIKKITICDKPKAVIIEDINGVSSILFQFSSIPLMYNELFLKICSALYKNFPDKIEEQPDENVKNYLETSRVPENIQKADTSAKFQTIFYVTFLIIVSSIPILLALLSAGWVICQILVFILKSIVSILTSIVG